MTVVIFVDIFIYHNVILLISIRLLYIYICIYTTVSTTSIVTTALKSFDLDILSNGCFIRGTRVGDFF